MKWLQKITLFHSFIAEYQNLCVLLTHVEVNNEIFNGIIISYFRAYCANHNRENVIIMVGGGEGNIKHYLLCVHSTCRKSYDDKVSSKTGFTNSMNFWYLSWIDLSNVSNFLSTVNIPIYYQSLEFDTKQVVTKKKNKYPLRILR